MTTIQKQAKGSLNRKWESKPISEVKREKLYSSDDLINAYLKGKKDQKDAEKRILIERFSENLKSAKKLSVELYNHLHESKIECKYVSVKIVSIDSFETIFVIPKKDFISDELKSQYKHFTNEIKSEVSEYHFSFSFMPYTKKINKNKMLSDGFTLTYGKNE